MEAIRVRAIANGDPTNIEGASFDDLELKLAVAAVETGTMSRPASILIQAGFASRLAAIKAVTDTNAQFESGGQLRVWLSSDQIAALTDAGNWPTPETAEMWRGFRASFAPTAQAVWTERTYLAQTNWNAAPPQEGQPLRIRSAPQGLPYVLAPDGAVLGRMNAALNPGRKGLLRATVGANAQILLNYVGPDDFWIT